MTPLEQMLREAAVAADWPPTPDLAAAVIPRLDDGVRPLAPSIPLRRPPTWYRRPLALALAILLLLAATAAAIPGIREPVLDWLGLRSVRIERVPQPLPEPPGATLALGQHTTLAAARRRLEFTPVLPTGLGEPVVYYEGFPPGGQLGLVYRDGRLFITEVQGHLEQQFLFKFLRSGTGVERVSIDGGRGLWIAGPHQYAYADRTGEIRTDSVRKAGPVLLWRRGDLLLRLEGARTKAEALRIARSVRAAP